MLKTNFSLESLKGQGQKAGPMLTAVFQTNIYGWDLRESSRQIHSVVASCVLLLQFSNEIFKH